MIRLDLKREPHWLDLGHGVRVHVRPRTTALMMAARAAVQRATVPSQNETVVAGERTAALVKALGRLGIEEWDGVGDAEGAPVPLTAEGVDALLDLWPMAEGLGVSDRGHRADQPALPHAAAKSALHRGHPRQAAGRHCRAEEGDGDRGQGEADRAKVVEATEIVDLLPELIRAAVGRPPPPPPPPPLPSSKRLAADAVQSRVADLISVRVFVAI
jgi:hypothetical protein